ncbi:DoxX family protein [Cyclobacterium sp.]|uniref:DoxX family protein n=1 Tax=Cyclobacterium sp. TaxID=1966343 RepID=UPI0019C8670B|nr:DoxX family protein [Cyclobacterium sp.]MBD3631315.1 DoxX family protein [Cyclobacterium sp.]
METNEMSKTRKISAWILVGLMGALFVMSASMKLMGSEEMSANFSKWGLDGKLMLIGIGELIAAIFFIIPKTSSLGVLLLSAHLGGAIVTHMSNDEMFIPQTVMLLVVWVANYLRNPEMLASFSKK